MVTPPMKKASPSYSSTYSTRCIQTGENFLVVPTFSLSTHKSAKLFGYSFAFDLEFSS